MASHDQGLILLSLLLFLNIFSFSLADIHHYEFVIEESEFTKLCSTKSVLTVNGDFPGPEIRVHRGDTVFVNVRNHGNQAVSMKWEGVEESVDGSDELIQPGRSFTYEIELEDEIGTLWWHASSAWSAATVHGAFVILPAAGEDFPFPAPYSEQTIVLGPWYKKELSEGIALGLPDAYTINGHPGETYGCSKDTSFQKQVDYSGYYLFHIVNAVANETMVFGIAYHSFTIVARNGAYTQRSFSSSLRLGPGETVDALFCANQNLGHYYMTARPSSGRPVTTGIIKYTTTSRRHASSRK